VNRAEGDGRSLPGSKPLDRYSEHLDVIRVQTIDVIKFVTRNSGIRSLLQVKVVSLDVTYS
jgi:hypothetical protein